MTRTCLSCSAPFPVVGEHSTRRLCPQCWNANQRATASEQARCSEDEADRRAPSEEQIREMTAAIREGWSEHVYFKRAGIAEQHVETLVVPSGVFTG